MFTPPRRRGAERGGGWRGGSSPAPPSSGFPRAKAIKRVIRLLKTDVNNGEEVAVTAVRQGRRPPGKGHGALEHSPRGPREDARSPAALGPQWGGRRQFPPARGNAHHASLCPRKPPERTGEGPGQRGLRGRGWVCRYHQPFKPCCSPANPRHKLPHRALTAFPTGLLLL